MASSHCLAHPALFTAVGSSSDETKTILNKALSYLGIWCATSKRDTISASAFGLSFPGNVAFSDAERIEFDSKTTSWYRVPTENTSREKFPMPRETKGDTTRAIEDVATNKDVHCAISSEISEDWTTLLSATAHVDFLKSRNWHKTSLGLMISWPPTLRLMTMTMLADPRPANLYWLVLTVTLSGCD